MVDFLGVLPELDKRGRLTEQEAKHIVELKA